MRISFSSPSTDSRYKPFLRLYPCWFSMKCEGWAFVKSNAGRMSSPRSLLSDAKKTPHFQNEPAQFPLWRQPDYVQQGQPCCRNYRLIFRRVGTSRIPIDKLNSLDSQRSECFPESVHVAPWSWFLQNRYPISILIKSVVGFCYLPSLLVLIGRRPRLYRQDRITRRPVNSSYPCNAL